MRTLVKNFRICAQGDCQDKKTSKRGNFEGMLVVQLQRHNFWQFLFF